MQLHYVFKSQRHSCESVIDIVFVMGYANKMQNTLCLKKGYYPSTNDNFNNCCPIPVIFGTNIAE